MSLLTEKTELEKDLAQVDGAILAVGEASHHLAGTLHRVWREFWALPTERLLAVLNADVARTLAIFAENTATGETINAALDAINAPQWSTRAPVVVGREDIIFDEVENKFVVSEVPSPE